MAIATISMGLALGIATSVFALMDAMTNPEPPFEDVAMLYSVTPRFLASGPAPPADSVYAAIGRLAAVERAATSRASYEQFALIAGNARRLTIRWLGPGAIELLGVRARRGRTLTESDYLRGDVAMVSDLLWRRDFENRDEIGDATVTVGSQVFRVVGVLPSGTDRSVSGEIFAPDSAGRWTSGLGMSGGMIVRLKPGFAEIDLDNQLSTYGKQLNAIYAGPRDRGFRVGTNTLQPDPVRMRDLHRAMIGAAICILIIACANIAALMLSRGMVRKRDYALRLALGAQPREIALEVVAEVSVLALIGSVAGVIVTMWIVGLLSASMPAEMRWEGFSQPQWSWRVFALSAGAVAISIVVAGGYPAWRAGRTDPAGPLKEGAGTSTGRSGTRFRWLVIGELALAMMLMICSSLMLKSVRKVEDFRFGYAADRLLYASVSMPWRQDSVTVAAQDEFRRQGLDFVRRVKGVSAVIPLYPMTPPPQYTEIVSDRTVSGGPSVQVQPSDYGPGMRAVGAEYFTTIGLEVLEGRDFAPGDAAQGGAVALDVKTAKMLFPHESAVGRLVKLGSVESSAPWLPVVGVVRNHQLYFTEFPEVGADTLPLVYATLPEAAPANRKGEPRGTRNLHFLIRTQDDANFTMMQLATSLTAITPATGTRGIERWNENQQQRLRVERYTALIFTLLGAASLVLGAAGLFSVISYIAAQRRREYAVRIALGATRPNVANLVLREGFLMAIGGTGVGAVLGMWAGFMIWSRLWGVYPIDVEALVIAEIVLVATTMAACLVPALRATRSDPLEVMRAA